MPKVQELARELGLTSQEVLRHLRRIGRPAAGHTSAVDEDVAARLRAELGNGAPEPGGGIRSSAEGGDAAATTVLPRAAREFDTATARGDDAAATSTLPRADGAEAPSFPGGEPGTPAEERETSEGERRTSEGETKKKARRSFAHQLAELPVLIFFAFIIAVIIKTFLAQAFFIPSESMLPTLRVGDRVLVEKLGYRFGDPSRGDIIVFAQDVLGDVPDVPWTQDARNFLRELLGLPTGTEEDYIKRVVAVGGDTIRYAGTPRRLEINGEVVDEPYVRGNVDRGSGSFTATDCKRFDMDVEGRACVVPAGMIFVMGDNRSNSSDSRAFGPIAESKVVGRAFVVIWPPGDFGGL